MSLETKDYYRILQVDPSADPEVIEAAYKRLARKYHPDTNKSPVATLRMQEMNAAYGVLRNPVKRVQYDRERSFRSSRPDAKYEEERRKREAAEAARQHPTMEGYRLSIRQAAQAISVTRGTLQDYIKSGRVSVNPDGTIDAVELLRAGFIIRKLPPRGE